METLELKLDFVKDTKPLYARPLGYKGFAGFHKYWGKKPVESWQLLIENLTDSDDVILDPFLGSGLIARECSELNRRFIGFDVNPISIELGKLYLDPPAYLELKCAIAQIRENLKSKIDEMYKLPNGMIVSHFLWDDGSITKAWCKKGHEKTNLNISDEERVKFQTHFDYKSRYIKDMRLFNNSRINTKEDNSLTDFFSPRALRTIDMIKEEIDCYSGNLKRALLLTLTSAMGQMSNMVFAVSKRGKAKGKIIEKVEVGSWVIGYWRPQIHFEINAWNCYENKANKLLKAIRSSGSYESPVLSDDAHSFFRGEGDSLLITGDSETLLKTVPLNSIKVILTDPPHGDRIPYLELSEMWNCALGMESNYSDELVVSNAKDRNKDTLAYNKKLYSILSELERVLADDGILAIMFNSRHNNHWDSLLKLETSLGFEYIGQYPMEYSASSVIQDNRKGSLKTDKVLLFGKNMSLKSKHKITEFISMVNRWRSSNITERD